MFYIRKCGRVGVTGVNGSSPSGKFEQIAIYQKQIKRQKKIPPPLVEIDGEKEYEVEKILNRKDVREKMRYLVRWKEYITKEDMQKRFENLENVIDLVEEFEKKIREKKIKKSTDEEREGERINLNLKIEVFKRSKLSEKYITKILFK